MTLKSNQTTPNQTSETNETSPESESATLPSNSHVPSLLPKKRGRPPGSKNQNSQSQTTTTTLTKPQKSESESPEGFRIPPSDPKERANALLVYRPLVRPVVTGSSSILKSLEVTPLSNDETEDGIEAFSALAYQYGAKIDARIIVLVWLLAILVSRVPEYLELRKKRRLEAKNAPVNLDTIPKTP